MNGICAVVLLSGLILNPASLVGEKAYIHWWQDKVVVQPTEVEVHWEPTVPDLGLEFLFEQILGDRAAYASDWVRGHGRAYDPPPGIRDYEEVEIALDQRRLRLTMQPEGSVLSYERGYG